MFLESQSSSTVTLAVTALLLTAVGSIAYLALGVLELETKWFVAGIVALCGVGVFVMIKDKERFLWICLVFCFQLDISLRIFHGYAGSPGLTFGAPFVVGSALAVWLMLPNAQTKIRNFTFGGFLSAPILALFTISIISALLSNEQFLGLISLLTSVQYYFLFLLALNYIDTEEKLALTIKVLLAVLVVQSIIYYIQVALGVTFTVTGEVIDAGGRSSSAARPGGTVSTNPAGYASFMLPLVCICAAFFVWLPLRISTMLRFGVPLALGLAAIVLTLTRAAWGSTIIGLVSILLLSLHYKRLSSSKLTLLAIAAAIVVVMSIPFVLGRLNDSPLEGSYNERVTLMQMALELIKAKPLLGVGPFAYRPSLAEYLPYELWHAWRAAVHNHYLLRTAETGIFGGLAFIVFYGASIRQSFRLARSDNQFLSTVGIGVFGSLLAISFEMLWDIFAGYTYNALIWFMIGIMGAAYRLDLRNDSINPPSIQPN